MYTASNPILPGFRPDPSACRVGDDFYIVTSSFAYFPGVPIYHSRDLANWEQIGSVLTRPSQLPLEGAEVSQGIFAPTLRYYKGTFYMITTNIQYGNFIVTAKDIQGPWSEPYYLGEDAPGIDPSLYFEEDEQGKDHCYYIGTRPNPKGVRYNGDWEVWIQEVSLDTMKLIGESKKVWKGAMHHVIWPEGPHLYKKDGWYYVMNAEGGTGPNHGVAIARSRNIWGPYIGNPNNPILTHRHLGKEYPVCCVGHGDFFDDGKGNWYMVMLASRSCDGYVNTGRDTWLAKVTWEDDWPVVNPGVGKLEDIVELPGDEIPLSDTISVGDFSQKKLSAEWMALRTEPSEMSSLGEREGYLRMKLLPGSLKDKTKVSFLGIRQENYDYFVSVAMDFTPSEKEEAGIVLFCNEEHHLKCCKVSQGGKTVLKVVLVIGETSKELACMDMENMQVTLAIKESGQYVDLLYRTEGREWVNICNHVCVKEFSTELSGGFTGCLIGLYTTSNGNPTENYADFSCFVYEK